MSKRGRPARFSSEYMSLQRVLYPEIKTERGILNKAYQQHAVGVLLHAGIENFKFLFDVETDTVLSGVLRELGKIDNDSMILLIAELICQRAKTEKHTVRKWGAFVKYYQFCLEQERTDNQKVMYLARHDLDEFFSETVSENSE